MKITFSNLGAIKKTTLDLRPLTVIIGPNNSNKTYIAYSIYGMLSELEDIFHGLYDELEYEPKYQDSYSIELNNRFLNNLKTAVENSNEFFKETLETFFQDSSRKVFSKTNLKINIPFKEIKERVIEKLPFGFITLEEDFDIFLEKNPLKIIFLVEKFWQKANHNDNDIELNFSALQFFTSLLFPKPFLLPAERNALIITYKMLANRRYKLLRDSRRNFFTRRIDERQLELLKEQGDIRYPQPVEDFLDFLTDIELQTNIRKNPNERLRFHELAHEIEQNIQGKNTTLFKPTKFGGKEIKVKVKRGLDIDLYNASSSIKQLAPLLLYLRYRAKENDLLIIDEPEMNLHPESQAKLLEVLGMLVNAGVNVLLTTHSPYFMSHLNNLIAGDINDEVVRKKQAKSLYLGDERAFLKPEDVSAYEMRQNKAGNQTLHDLKDADYGIRWDTLSDVSADIQQKFFEIYEQKEKNSKGKKN